MMKGGHGPTKMLPESECGSFDYALSMHHNHCRKNKYTCTYKCTSFVCVYKCIQIKTVDYLF